MKAELIDVMGDDLRVVNAARVSFDKESALEEVRGMSEEGWEWATLEVAEKDIKLLNYLAKNGHWTPFSHVMITMRETVPIFVARQRFKHMVGFTYNEVSRRYVDAPPEFYTPDVWRGKPINAKQGSSDAIITEIMTEQGMMPISEAYLKVVNWLSEYYQHLVDSGVAPEQARMVLPQSMYTSYYVTGSLSAWSRAFLLRSDVHAQKEIQELASQWKDIMDSIPNLQHSWKALTE